MTVFLTPDAASRSSAGTYFPPGDRARHAGLPHGARRASPRRGASRRDEVEQQARADRRRRSARGRGCRAADAELGRGRSLDGGARALARRFDDARGGFGGAPKFPHTDDARVPAAAARVRGDADARCDDRARRRSTRWRAGGIYDHLGGGFARYSTDERWLVPHFEKMLYDNAQLAPLYLEAWPRHARRPLPARGDARRSTTLLREMQHAEGGFYSAQDADSEGVEGEVLRRGRGTSSSTSSGARRRARASAPSPDGQLGGDRTCCGVPAPLAERRARASGIEPAALARRDRGRPGRALFEARERRVSSPATDDKVLTAWNGADDRRARRGRPRVRRAGVRRRRGAMRRRSSRRTCRDERRPAAPVVARRASQAGRRSPTTTRCWRRRCLTLYETTFEVRWFERRRDARGRAARRRFRDDERGGFFQTASDARGPGRFGRRSCTTTRRRPGTRSRPRRAPAARGSHRRRRATSTPAVVGPAPGPRRDGGGADRVRSGALRARPVRRPRRTRSRSSAIVGRGHACPRRAR